MVFSTIVGSAKPSALDIPLLTKESKTIIFGKILKIRCHGDEKGRLVTSADISINEIWKGHQKKKIITVLQPGGILGGIVQKNKNQRPFKVGREIVLFLTQNKKGDWVIVSLWQGHFDISLQDQKHDKIVSNNGFAGLNEKGMTLKLSDLKGLVEKELQ